jgi:hypothetical protein
MNPLPYFLFLSLNLLAFIGNAQSHRILLETNDYILEESDSAFYYSQGIAAKSDFGNDMTLGHQNKNIQFSPSNSFYAYCQNYEKDLGEIVVKNIKANKAFKIKIGMNYPTTFRWVDDYMLTFYRVYFGDAKDKHFYVRYFVVEIKQ